jgi:hypothetical protein
MSTPEEEGGDYYDILGFPGDGFNDMDDTNPDDPTQDLDGGHSPVKETGATCGQRSVKKHKKSDGVPLDNFVSDRIKTLKKPVCGV